jgi:Flp pilus assembly protein TadD
MHNLTAQQAIRLGIQHHQAGRLAEAEAVYRQVLVQSPNHPEAIHLLGAIAMQTGQLDLALQFVQRAVAIDPRAHHFRVTLGQVLAALGRFEDAIAAYQGAVAIKPDYANSHFLLGNALFLHGQAERSIESFRRALAVDPNHADALGSLGGALHSLGKLDEAEQTLRRAIQLDPRHAAAEHNLALTLLLKGDFEQGLCHYEARHRATATGVDLSQFTRPQWAGDALSGRRILLHGEQGFGDAIQFVRYAPLVAQRGGRVNLRCRPELVRLFQTIDGVETVISRDLPLPEHDLHCPLLSLPLAMRTTPATIPASIPYLRPLRARRWELPGGELKVGLCWAGLAHHVNDRNRSLAVDSFTPLATVPGIRFISLQKPAQPGPPMPLIDLANDLGDFADTADLIQQLDLVISVDTAIAHLAGALGKEVWTLLPFVPDWRWMLNRQDTPWYPTMRLLRQPIAGDWSTPIRQAAQMLEQRSRRS